MKKLLLQTLELSSYGERCVATLLLTIVGVFGLLYMLKNRKEWAWTWQLYGIALILLTFAILGFYFTFELLNE